MLLVMVRDLLFASKIDATSRRLGVPVAWAPRGVSLVEAAREHRSDAVLVDLGEPRALEQVRALLADQPGVRVTAFVGHLRTDLIDEAHAAGVVEVLTRGQLNATLDDVLLRASGGAPAVR